MNTWFYLGVFLLLLIGMAHFYLGERYILIRLFRRGGLPPLFGDEAVTRQTLRFAWPVTTLAGFCCVTCAFGARATQH